MIQITLMNNTPKATKKKKEKTYSIWEISQNYLSGLGNGVTIGARGRVDMALSFI